MLGGYLILLITIILIFKYFKIIESLVLIISNPFVKSVSLVIQLCHD
jgi:hypothetical protein